jgi:hypothetical protein
LSNEKKIFLNCKNTTYNPHFTNNMFIQWFGDILSTYAENLVIHIEGRTLTKDENGCLLGCNAEYSGRSLPTFQRSLLPPSSGR